MHLSVYVSIYFVYISMCAYECMFQSVCMDMIGWVCMVYMYVYVCVYLHLFLCTCTIWVYQFMHLHAHRCTSLCVHVCCLWATLHQTLLREVPRHPLASWMHGTSLLAYSSGSTLIFYCNLCYLHSRPSVAVVLLWESAFKHKPSYATLYSRQSVKPPGNVQTCSLG